MKITQVRLGRLSVPLRVPFKTALRRVDQVNDIVVELHTDTGAVGYGEAPPTGPITGDTAGGILGGIRELIAPVILNQEVDDFEALTAKVQKAGVHNTSAKAAVDMALWDLYGQLHHIPVHKLLGGARRTLVTDITISVNPPEEMAKDALDAVARGYDCLKVKVGDDPALDTARLAAVASTPTRPGPPGRRCGFSTKCRTRAWPWSWWSSRWRRPTWRVWPMSPGTAGCL